MNQVEVINQLVQHRIGECGCLYHDITNEPLMENQKCQRAAIEATATWPSETQSIYSHVRKLADMQHGREVPFFTCVDPRDVAGKAKVF